MTHERLDLRHDVRCGRELLVEQLLGGHVCVLARVASRNRPAGETGELLEGEFHGAFGQSGRQGDEVVDTRRRYGGTDQGSLEGLLGGLLGEERAVATGVPAVGGTRAV